MYLPLNTRIPIAVKFWEHPIIDPFLNVHMLRVFVWENRRTGKDVRMIIGDGILVPRSPRVIFSSDDNWRWYSGSSVSFLMRSISASKALFIGNYYCALC